MKSGQNRDKPLTRERVIELLDRINRRHVGQGSSKSTQRRVPGERHAAREQSDSRRMAG